LDLSSFVLTITVDNTNNGQLVEHNTSIGYIKEPIAMYRLTTFAYDGGSGDGARNYLVDGRSYDEDQVGSWRLFEAGSSAAPDPTKNSELRSSILAGVLTAQLVGQEDLAGVPLRVRRDQHQQLLLLHPREAEPDRGGRLLPRAGRQLRVVRTLQGKLARPRLRSHRGNVVHQSSRPDHVAPNPQDPAPIRNLLASPARPVPKCERQILRTSAGSSR